MADRRFFAAAGPFTLAELAALTGATTLGDDAGDRLIRDVAPLDTARPDEVTFLSNRKYDEAFGHCRAGAAFVHPDLAAKAPEGMALLLTDRPYKAFAAAAQAFYPAPPLRAGIAASAVIDATARLGAGCEVAAHVVIGARVEIGRDVRIGANTVLGDGVILGEASRIGANVTLSHCIIGARTTIFPGARIGQDGFGFAVDPEGHVKVPQLGRVIIGDDVEIGANTTIDRGAGPDTVIGDGTMIDNLVQIGHNVVLGRRCAIAAQVGISGSTRIGDFVMMGGQAGLAGHLSIGIGARIAAQSGVVRDVPPGVTVCGFPALPSKEFWRQVAIVRRMARKRDG